MSDPRAATCLGLEDAVRHVGEGGLLAFPTETVFGLGADAGSEPALERLRAWKGRDAAQPVSILVEDGDALAELGFELPACARALADAFWPGALTLVLPAPSTRFASGVARGDGAVGVRCSPDPTASGLAAALRRAGVGPLTATSLNRSGDPPAADVEAARAVCAGDPDLALLEPVAPRPAGAGVPSTVVDCTGAELQVIREGAVSAEALARVAPLPPAPVAAAAPSSGASR